MFYPRISQTPDPARTAERLLALREGLRASGVPPRSDGTLLLATWNIREFDSESYGARGMECLYYIAEICSHFDLIAIQEVREDLRALETLRDLLGPGWSYIVSDVTEGKPGNRERMAFLFDGGKVRFNGIAGEIVIPPVEVKEGGKTVRYDPSDQFYRSPYLVGFRSGWATLMLCTVHILYGKDAADDPDRTREIQQIGAFLAARAKERTHEYSNLILLGDFNIFGRGDVTMAALTGAGFEVPPELQSVPATNTGSKKRHYDQIAFLPQRKRMETTGRAGVFNYFDHVYTDADEALYAAEMGEAYQKTGTGNPRDAAGRRSYYRTYWRTFQMSDHLPMWVELKTDFSTEYLQERAVRPVPLPPGGDGGAPDGGLG